METKPNDKEKDSVFAFVTANAADLEALGLLFLRLLDADFHVLDSRPSPTLAVVLDLEQKKKLGLKKELTRLFSELRATGEPTLTNGFGGSVLRM